jgi:GT2 family glycosyltransferase
VSVVVATYNRQARLGRLLDSLGAQRNAPPFEVVVVDDGSTDGTGRVLEDRHPPSFTLRVVRQQSNRGPAAARNAGWRAATGDVVCFTDDDCRPEPDWLGRLLAALEGVDVAQGRTVPDPAEAGNRGPFSRTMHVPYEQGFYETCNIAYRRQWLHDLGGFDERFRFPQGEDTDLAWRARGAGARTAFAADAVVRHAVWPSDFTAHLRDMRRRDGLVLMYRKHPGLRRHFGRRVLFRQIHGPTIAAAGALLALSARRRSPACWFLATAAGGWYAWVCHLVRPGPPRRWQWPIVLPLAFVADVYEVAVMARASVRYRTLLL